MNYNMKLALGAVGFTSLLVLIVPGNFNIAEKPEAEKQTPAPTLSTPSNTISQPVNNRPQIADEQDDGFDENFQFGDPVTGTDPFNEEDYDQQTDQINTERSLNIQQGRIDPFAAGSNNNVESPSTNSTRDPRQNNPTNEGTSRVISETPITGLTPVD